MRIGELLIPNSSFLIPNASFFIPKLSRKVVSSPNQKTR